MIDRVTAPRPVLLARALPAAALSFFLAVLPAGLNAQSIYDPVIRVNDALITRFDIAQRAELLGALGGAGELDDEARERLIDERLQAQAAAAAGLEATEEAVIAGIEELAARANTTADEFVAQLAENGVAEETLYDFIEAGVLWREVIRGRFASRANVSEEEVDQAVALLGREGGVRVLLSEIILPARDPAEAAASDARAAEIGRLTGTTAFAEAARNFSVSQTRGAGGRLDWLPLTRMPPALRAELLTLPPGGITSPVRIPNAVAIFQLRAIEELPVSEAPVLAIDYAEFRIPNGTPADARAVAGEIDTCDDLYGIAYDLPADRLVREDRPVAEIPRDIRAALETLDVDETSIAVRRGNVQLLLMMCGRTTAASEEVDRATLRRALVNQRIESYAAGYLAELKADALIVELQ